MKSELVQHALSIVAQLAETPADKRDDLRRQLCGEDAELKCVLAEADPNDAQKQRDLLVSHYKLGQVYRSVKDSAKSVAAFDAALLAEEVDDLIGFLEAERKHSEQLRDAP